jgi:hypothetical protein
MLFTSPVFEISALLNETILALYPALIKVVNTNTETTVFSRNICFCILAFILAKPSEIKGAFEPSLHNVAHHLMMGGLSFLTLTLAYNGFHELPLEICMPIFFSYPWFILLLGFLLGRDEPPVYIIPTIISYVLMLYFMKPRQKQIERLQSFPPEKRYTKYLAILGCIGAALLVGANFFIYKSGIESHSTGTLRTYFGALIISIVYFIYNQRLPELDTHKWAKLIFFNGCIAFVASRFKIASIKHVPEIYYASFVFMGALIAYAVGEKIDFFKQKSSEDFHGTK